MAKDLVAQVLSVPEGGVTNSTTRPCIVSFTGDPTSGPGVAAPKGSIGARTDAPSIYVKNSNANNNAWVLIGFTPGAFSTFALTGNISPTPDLSGSSVHNYNPNGIATAAVIRQGVASGGATLTGLDAGAQQGNGAYIILENLGPGALTLAHQVGSLPSNQFLLPGNSNLTLPVNGAVVFLYDSTSSKWRVVSGAGGTTVNSSLAGQVTLTGVISPTQLGTLDTPKHNYDPAGLASASILRQDLSANVTITGIKRQPSGTLLSVQNVSSANVLTFTHNSFGLSTPENCFHLPDNDDWFLPPRGTATFVYNDVVERWVSFGVATNRFPDGDSSALGVAVGPPGTSGNVGMRFGGTGAGASGILDLVSGGTIVMQLERFVGIRTLSQTPLIAQHSFIHSGTDTAADFQRQFKLSGVRSPNSITGTTELALQDSDTIVRQGTTGVTNLTGMSGETNANGRVILLINISANNIVIMNEDGGSITAARRFRLSAGSITITPESTAQFWYDGAISRWRLVSVS